MAKVYNLPFIYVTSVRVKISYVFRLFMLPTWGNYKDVKSQVLLECVLPSLYYFPLYLLTYYNNI